ncbi:hypothetical protein Patl1_29151 [Pistacia atlantica]|uniref:Uncharacterized protein n=1 Tax=Pistacia atlantica TaxID=434234 RepID=A0ACC1BC44_9ROSI|nr:hypothetical protein Patl1_29151 [Pistacia atlantica]
MELNDPPDNGGASSYSSGTSYYMVSKGHLSVNAETPSHSPCTNRNSILWNFLGVCSDNQPLPPPPTHFRSSFNAPTNFNTLNSGRTAGQVHQIPSNLQPPIAAVVPPSTVCANPTADLSASTKRCRRFDGTTAEYRHQRKMRNRGSAERSRARRIAYDSELKERIKMLREEHEELKRKEKELRLVLEQARPLTLERSFSAPM